MAIQLTRATPDMLPDLARIMFEAFKNVLSQYGHPPDFPTLEIAGHLMGMLLNAPGFYGVAALDNGKVIGSNFLQECDVVGAVGPITVDPNAQAKGVGRALMQNVIDHGTQRHMPLRLLQDSFNMVSLSLYTSLGFDSREPILILAMPPAAQPHPHIRFLTASDLPQCDALCRQIFGFSRANELAGAFHAGFKPMVCERAGKITAYQTGGMLGHGVASTVQDSIDLMGQIALQAGPPMDRFFIPIRNHTLHRAALAAGGRAQRLMTYMTYGEFRPPQGVWLPSVGM